MDHTYNFSILVSDTPDDIEYDFSVLIICNEKLRKTSIIIVLMGDIMEI